MRLPLGSATHDTRWQAGDRLYRMVVRSLLPDEAAHEAARCLRCDIRENASNADSHA